MGKGRVARSSQPRPVDTLADLKRTVLAQQREAAERAARERERLEHEQQAAMARAREQRLFELECRDVVPLKPPDRVPAAVEPPAPIPTQRALDDQQALAASLSDEIDIDRYLDTDETLSYAAPSIGAEVVIRLRRGAWRITAQLDLHGLRRDEARDVLVDFLDDCRRHGQRCVRVIHGKGLGSVNREPVLKDKVRRWLVQRPDVLAFCQAPPNDGGSGALLVLLAGATRDRSGMNPR